MQQVLIGTVGYYPFLCGYPLGPEFMKQLEAGPWPHRVTINEMNWGPVAIVQDLQSRRVHYDRAVIVASVDRDEKPGTVMCRRWLGGHADALELQARMHEALTGTISLDNLLLIGEHFKIWPAEVITVELQWREQDFSEFVLGELEHPAKESAVIGEKPMTPDIHRLVERLVAVTRRAVIGGARGMPELLPLRAAQLRPVGKVLLNRFVKDLLAGTD